MNPVRAIIVDGKPANHRRLAQLLQKHCREVEVSGVAETLTEAISLTHTIKPELVFLAIVLPDGSGFDLFEHFKPVPFKVIFVTGYREYAYQAIKYHAVDYLLNPINKNELVEAVHMAVNSPVDEQYRKRLNGIHQQYPDPEKIILADSSGFQIINASEIICLEANGNYTDLYLVGDRKLTYCRILKEFANLLRDHKFIKRVHRSYIVNLNHIKSFSNDGIIKLQEGHTASVGDSFREDFLSFFQRH
jgi:two-component system LytT family response regulator